MAEDNAKRPKVTVGVFILKDGKFLMGKRKGGVGTGTWGVPGGKLEFGESFDDCAVREVLEETGLKIKNIRFGTITNNYFQKENEHYVSIGLIADYLSGTERIMEPDKCSEWRWCDWNTDKLPRPLFQVIENVVKQDFNPFKK